MSRNYSPRLCVVGVICLFLLSTAFGDRTPAWTHASEDSVLVEAQVQVNASSTQRAIKPSGLGGYRQKEGVIYVSLNGDDSWDGLSAEWDGVHGPKATIQAGIDAADPEGNDEVVILPGIYTGCGNRDLDFCGKAITVRSIEPDNRETVEQTVIDCEGSVADYHRGFCFMHYEGPDSILNGVTITGGYANRGGGVYCLSASPKLLNCVFRSNGGELGGGLCIYYSIPTIVGCVFAENECDYAGGGIYNGYGNATVSDCVFRRNNAVDVGDGGGICNYWGESTLVNCEFVGNYAGGDGGGIHNYQSDSTLVNCVISRNSSAQAGGGLYARECDTELTGCAISRNSGRGIYSIEGNLQLKNCNVVENSQGIGVLDGYLDIENSILWGNGISYFNQNTQIHCDYDNRSISYSCIQGLTSLAGNGNIGDDPLLTGDGIHIQSGSPCIGQANPNNDYSEQMDLDGESRAGDQSVDIGADEFFDSENDGLPDWWETEFFGGSTSASPYDDNDEDARENLAEYEESTNPHQTPSHYYVDVDGDDLWDGLSPSWDGTHGPKATVQEAIELAHPREGDVVVIMPGTYSGDGNRDLDYRGKAIELRSSDPANEDIVSSTTIDCGGHHGQEHRGFRFRSMEKNASILNGVTVRGGYVDDKLGFAGGGVYCYQACPAIVNCVLKENEAKYGGGVANASGAPEFSNCNFLQNEASSEGGGLYSYSGNTVVADCDFIANESDVGGGIHNRCYSTIELSNCVFRENSACSAAGGVCNARSVSSTGKLCVRGKPRW